MRNLHVTIRSHCCAKNWGEQVAPMTDVPFAGGALGYWGYDLARRMITLPSIAQDAEQMPAVAVGIYDWALVLDHRQHTARLVSHQRFPETAELLPQILHRLQSNPSLPQNDFRVHGKITSNFTPDRYANAFTAVQNYLQAGDCYQINLAQRFSAAATGDAFGAYLTLAQPESRTVFSLSQSASCPDSMRLAGTFPARAQRQRGNQTDQRYPPARRRCAAR